MTRHAIAPAPPLLTSVMARHPIADAREPAATWGWAAMRRTLALWRHRARARAELRLIPDHLFRDMPFEPEMLLSERDKPFWKA